MDDGQDDEAGAETAGTEGDVPGWLRDLGTAGLSEEQAAGPPADDSA